MDSKKMGRVALGGYLMLCAVAVLLTILVIQEQPWSFGFMVIACGVAGFSIGMVASDVHPALMLPVGVPFAILVALGWTYGLVYIAAVLTMGIVDLIRRATR